MRVIHDPSVDVPYYYINNIEISHTDHDFTMSCAKLPSRLPQEALTDIREKSQLILTPLVQIYIPTTVINGLIDALTIQKEKYEEKFGKIPVREKGKDE